MANIAISEINDEITSASQLDGNELILISDVNSDSSLYTSKKVNLTNVKDFVGSTIKNQDKTVTKNGIVTADDGYTGLGTVKVAVPNSYYGSVEITSNGDKTSEVKGKNAVIVNVPTGSTIKNQDKTVTSNGAVTADSGYTGLGTVTVNVPTGTARSSDDLTVSGATVTVPAGLYSSQSNKSVSSGTAGTPTVNKGSVTGSGASRSISITPSVTNTTGYITGSTKTGSAVSVTAKELATGNIALTSQTAVSCVGYSTASINVNSVSNLSESNIRKGVTILGKTGTYTEMGTCDLKLVVISSKLGLADGENNASVHGGDYTNCYFGPMSTFNTNGTTGLTTTINNGLLNCIIDMSSITAYSASINDDGNLVLTCTNTKVEVKIKPNTKYSGLVIKYNTDSFLCNGASWSKV